MTHDKHNEQITTQHTTHETHETIKQNKQTKTHKPTPTQQNTKHT